MSKIRLDQYLCQNGLVQSRERAKALIMSGIVFVNEQKADKAGEMIAPDAKVEVRGTISAMSAAAASSWRRRCRSFPCGRTARSAWTSVRPPAALPTACCKMVQ